MWKRSIGFLVIVVVIMAILWSLFHRQQVERITSRLSDQVEQGVARQRTTMEAELASVHSDLQFLVTSLELTLVKNGKGGDDAAMLFRVLKENFRDFSSTKQRYDQIRFLDWEGNEKIRVNLIDGKGVIVADDRLQSKRHRYYFTDSISKEVGELYVSPFDLNMEHKKIELPFKPMIRFAMPVADGGGAKAGVVIFNYLGNSLLNHLGKLIELLPGKTAMLNSKGEYLISFKADQSWGFMFSDRGGEQFSVLHGEVWQQMLQSPRGQVTTREGDIYTFSWLKLGGESVSDCAHCATAIVHRISAGDIDAAHDAEMAPIRPIIITVLLLLASGIMILFWNMQQRQRTARQLEALNRSIEEERDIFAVGPAVIFRWRNEFGWPVEYASGNLNQVFGYDSERFLSGELGLANIVDPTYLSTLTAELQEGLSSAQEIFSFSPYRLVDNSMTYHWVSSSVRVVRDSEGKVLQLYSYVTDISPLKAAEMELQQSREFVQKVVDTIADPTLVIDVGDFKVISANQAACDAYLAQGQTMEGLTCYQLSHKTHKPCDSKEEPCPIQTILEFKEAASVVHKHYDAKGLPFYVEVHATPILDKDGEVAQIVESHRDITQHVNSNRELTQLAATDPLTGTLNRKGFEEQLEQAIINTAQGGHQLGLIMFDLDHFKPVNDTYGHDMGDHVLKGVTTAVESSIRQYDLLGRWGGDEFFVLLPRVDQKGLEVAAENIRLAISGYPFPIAERVTTSIGATIWQQGDSSESMIKRVDQALYLSKETRDRVTIAENHKDIFDD